MIAVLDGMSGAGKTTTIAALLKKFEPVGVRATSIKPIHNDSAPPFSAFYDWTKVIHGVSRMPVNSVILIDRGLGSEYLFSSARGYDRTYQASIHTLHMMTQAHLECLGHHFAEYVMVIDRETQIDRGRVLYRALPDDTRHNWEQWVQHTNGVIVDTSVRPQEDVVSFIFEAILWSLLKLSRT